jgi:SAM-dependent methyltransferase
MRVCVRRLRLRLRLCRRRPVTTEGSPDLPPGHVLGAQDALIAPMRSRIFRRIGIGHRGPVLDLGAGPGVVSGELSRRSRGPVVALDRDPIVKKAPANEQVVADATELPFEAGRFDLVYVQFVFLWNDAEARRRMAREIARVLGPEGVAVIVEPDWRAAIEHPAELAIAPIVADAIARAGGFPDVGRRLPSELADAGLRVRVEQSPELSAPDPARFDALEGLPLSDDERARLSAAKAADCALRAEQKLTHVPLFFLTADRRRGP